MEIGFKGNNSTSLNVYFNGKEIGLQSNSIPGSGLGTVVIEPHMIPNVIKFLQCVENARKQGLPFDAELLIDPLGSIFIQDSIRLFNCVYSASKHHVVGQVYSRLPVLKKWDATLADIYDCPHCGFEADVRRKDEREVRCKCGTIFPG